MGLAVKLNRAGTELGAAVRLQGGIELVKPRDRESERRHVIENKVKKDAGVKPQQRAKQPRGFRTLWASWRKRGRSNQWKADMAVTKSAEPSANGRVPTAQEEPQRKALSGADDLSPICTRITSILEREIDVGLLGVLRGHFQLCRTNICSHHGGKVLGQQQVSGDSTPISSRNL
ncbi:hypothetical protein EYF80_037970 [Liparis tanakae]|uniref:Uncharacterized protein n=1 Tax=Liparis tanakae TaxID=230148 RepID=A0A4Z2GGK6_9TELE|nr:hypothetical protein EYF80_037970 [Liparis tanakae]